MIGNEYFICAINADTLIRIWIDILTNDLSYA